MRLSTEKEENYEAILCWQNCPDEILLAIFEKMTASSLIECLFVNSRWRRLVMYVLRQFDMWEEVIETTVFDKEQFSLRSKASLDWQQIYYNHILWHSIEKASMEIQTVREITINKMYTYRDNLIVVTPYHVAYYDVDDLKLKRTVNISCHDFQENDFMIIVAQYSNNKISLKLYKKENPIDFNMCDTIAESIENVLTYRIHEKECYVFNHDQHNFLVWIIEYPEWRTYFSKYYGSPSQSAQLHIFNSSVFLSLKHGSVLTLNKLIRNLVPINQIVSCDQTTMSVYNNIFHRFGFLFAVRDENISQYEQMINNPEFITRSSEMSCVTQHGHMIIMGYEDGTIDIYTMQDFLNTAPLRRYRIPKLTSATTSDNNVEITCIDVHEGKGIQYLFVATSTALYQIGITYSNYEEYMWKKYSKIPQIVLF